MGVPSSPWAPFTNRKANNIMPSQLPFILSPIQGPKQKTKRPRRTKWTRRIDYGCQKRKIKKPVPFRVKAGPHKETSPIEGFPWQEVLRGPRFDENFTQTMKKFPNKFTNSDLSILPLLLWTVIGEESGS